MTDRASSTLNVEHTPEALRIFRPGPALSTGPGAAQGTPGVSGVPDGLILEQRAASGLRPYIHPIVAPDGAGVITQDVPLHHPWQHGLYTGLHHVGGVDFWKQASEDPSGQSGTIHPEPLAAPQVDGNRVHWRVESSWRAQDGAPVLAETQRWTLHDQGEQYQLDVEWTLQAQRDTQFGQQPYGGLFIRMPYHESRGASALNSEGQAGQEGEQQRARWLSVAMPIEGRPAASPLAGVAMLDHPGNHEHPVPWRLDRQYGISPSRCIVGAWSLSEGQSASERYRLLFFTGDIDGPAIDQAWHAFAKLSGAGSG